jgi:hypothetical protein
LAPCHQTCQYEVENTHPAAYFAEQAPTVDIVHQEETEDGELNAHADDHAIEQLVIGVALARLYDNNQGADARTD